MLKFSTFVFLLSLAARADQPTCDIRLSPAGTPAEQESFVSYVQPHQAFLDGVCYHLTGGGKSHDAEDLKQKILLRMWEHRHELPQILDFRSWANRMARNLHLDTLRHKSRATHHTQQVINETLHAPKTYTVPNDPDFDPILNRQVEAIKQEDAETFFASLNSERLVKAVRELSPRHREIFFLADVLELSYPEVGRRLNMKALTVGSNLFNARRRLREALTREQEADQ